MLNNQECLQTHSCMKEMARDDILITLATQLAIKDIQRYVLLKVDASLLSAHISMYGRRL